MSARSAAPTSRWLAAASVVAMLASAGVLASVVHERLSAAESGGALVQSRREGAGVGAGDGWRAVLATLDRRRAAAYDAADPELLARVYVRGSPALRRDRHLLTRYRERGLRVRGLRMDVSSLRVRRARGDRVVLVVRERLAGGTVTGPRSHRPLPGDDADRRVLVLRRVDDRGDHRNWRIAAVRAA